MTTHYTVTYAPRALRDLRKLPEKISTACVEFIRVLLSENPYRVGKPLTSSWDRVLLSATCRMANYLPH